MPTAVLLIVSWLHVCVLALLTCVAATSGLVSQHFNTLHATGTAHLFLAVGADLRLLRRRRAAGFFCSAFFHPAIRTNSVSEEPKAKSDKAPVGSAYRDKGDRSRVLV